MMRNITHEELTKRNFQFNLMYGDNPLYLRDGFGYLFKERGDKLEQIMSSYVSEVNPKHKPIGYLKERMLRLDEGEEMGLNNLPLNYDVLNKIQQPTIYIGTQMRMLREDGDL